MSSIIMAGVITSGIFLGTDRRPKVKTAIFQSISLALLMLIGGWICIPLGISKIRATPTWSMWCIGSAMLVFTLLYWICDLKGHTRSALLVKAAGSNTLLTYLLPDLWYFLFAAAGVTYLDTHLSFGWPAVIKTALFTVVMLSLATLLTKAKLRLQL
jgi:predicted acyltransferase